MDTSLVQLRASLQFAGAIPSPYLLFSLKKQFPVAFRTATGCGDNSGSCQGGEGCPCRQTFSQELSADTSQLRRHQKPPLPFLFEIPLLQGGVAEAEVGLLLIGSAATSHVEIYLRALGHLFGAAAPLPLKGAKLLRIEALALDGSRTTLTAGAGRFDLAAIPVTGFDELLTAPLGTRNVVTLELITPLRLMSHGRVLSQLPFHAVSGALFRRISSLASYYGGVELDYDFKWLADSSREVSCIAAELSFVNWGGGVQGVIGGVSYCGDLGEFLPFLQLGELLHAGKGAAYGMGKYELS